MVRVSRAIALALSCVSLLLAGSALAQESTSTVTEKRHFEIISVDGNVVVVKSERGVRELTLPADFKLDMNGTEIGVADLKPGMKGTAIIKTKVTSKPVVVTEIRQAEVLAVQMNSVIVRSADGKVRKYTTQDVADKNIAVWKDGERVELRQLRPGDRLTATIITKHPPVVTTEQEVKASVHEPAPAPAPVAAAPAPAPAPAAEPKPAEPPKVAAKLPKTGTNLPLAGGLGLLSLGVGLGLTLRRVRRAS